VSAGVQITVDGRGYTVPAGTSVAVALLECGMYAFRKSVRGEARGPICGMGVCFECRVTIDGQPHQRACLMVCTAGMSICTSRAVDG
jgi:D-hydroxyproline dehydrogenase subunit gamma